MIRSQQPALALFAVDMIGLGILALVYGDFAMVWQPVASWIPGKNNQNGLPVIVPMHEVSPGCLAIYPACAVLPPSITI